MDITARLVEARQITALFSEFDSRGYDAYDAAAVLLFDSLDRDETYWRESVANVIADLADLAEQARGQWFDAQQGLAVEQQLAALRSAYASEMALVPSISN